MKLLKLTLTVVGILLYSFVSGQVTYVVNTTDDIDDGACDGVHCSLREAINVASNDGMNSNIHFNITGVGPHIIQPTTNYAFPSLNFNSIDGTTQSGNNPMNSEIIIDCTNGYLDVSGEMMDIKGLKFQNGVSHIKSSGFFEGYIESNVFENATDISLNLIGGSTIGIFDNKFTNNAIAINNQNNSSIGPNNEMRCNGLGIVNSNAVVPSVNFISTTDVVGTSDPLEQVYLYLQDDSSCTGAACQGASYVSSTFADSNGDWSFTGLSLSTADAVAVNATRFKGTSAFSCIASIDCNSLSSNIDGLSSIIQSINHTFDGQPVGGNLPYVSQTWQQIGGAGTVNILNNNDGTATITGVIEGDVVLEYQVIDSQGCSNISQYNIIVLSSDLKAQISGATIVINNGSTYKFNGNPSLGTGTYVTHNWQQISGTGTISLTDNNDGTADVMGVNEGTISMEYEVIDSDNNTIKDTFDFSVVKTPSDLSAEIDGFCSIPNLSSAVYNGQPSLGTGIYVSHDWQQVGGTGAVSIVNNNDGTAQITGVSSGTVELEYTVIDSDGFSKATWKRINNVDTTYVINTTDVNDDGSCNSAHCSFIEAINAANNDNLASAIHFNISGAGPHEIAILGGYVMMGNDGDIINGLTQINNDPMSNEIVLSLSSSDTQQDNAIFGDNWTVKGLKYTGGGFDYIGINGSNNLITTNVFEDNYTAVAVGSGEDNIVYNNIFINNEYAVWTGDGTLVSENQFLCNEFPINENQTNGSGIIPSFTTANTTMIIGIAQPSDIIEIFSTNDTNCENLPCQGNQYVGTTTADASGNWVLIGDFAFTSGDQLVATATDINGNTSSFTNCFIILPDFCDVSESLPVNIQPCSTTGIVIDLKELTYSNHTSTSTCQGTYVDNDAWYSIEVPSTGNFLVRANLNNTVVPVIEAYTGDCDGLFLQNCELLDSVPYAMVFENYIPNSTVYLRVWDKDNTITGSASTALLHLTAHELPLDSDDWQICDQENSLINGNPTILSERDANSFIIQYEASATPAEIAAERAFFMNEGAELEDECICNSVALELWGTDNPIDVEERRQSARNRAKVDTSNYNYIFETIEFQVNAYAIGMQYATDVSMDAEGNFTLTWVDQQRRHNYGRVYRSSGNPITQEYQIGSSNKTQFEPSVAMQSNGDFVTVWHEIDEAVAGATYSIFGRQYDAEGNAKGLPFDISLDAAAAISSQPDTLAKYGYGANAEVAIADNGNFAVVWHVGSRIYVQCYDNTANKVGLIKQVNTNNTSSVTPHPQIVMRGTGEFIITWSGTSSGDKNIYFQSYDNLGNPIGNPLQVNTTSLGTQGFPDIAMTDTGEFIIVWESENQDGDDYGIFAQRYDATGNPVGGEFQVNTNSVAAQRHPSISVLNDGTFMIVWSSYINGVTLEDVYAQIFASNGTPINSEFQVNTFDEPEQEKPKTATNGSTIFIASWEDGANDGSFTGIFGQRYEVLDIAGNKIVYPIGTATPSTLLGQELAFPTTTYQPTDSVSNVRVAIIDTGIDPTNPYLINSLWSNQEAVDSDNCYTSDNNGYDFINETGSVIDFDGHGTKVNGIVTRDFDPNIQLEMMNVKFHELNQGKVFDAICGIYYAVDNGANVLNLSWGFEASEYPLILRDALQYASDNDVLIVTTAGNTSKNNDLINKYPCNLDIPNMIVVTSYGVDGQTGDIELANYASYGANNVDIAAYGYVETPELGGAIGKSAGTSLAAPAVTRTAATVKGLFPSLSAAEIKDCILNTAQYEANLDGRVFTNGVLDHNAAIECARQLAGNCIAIDLYITTPQNLDSTYRSDAYIGSNATLSNMVNVDYLAADSVMLDADFCVPLGAEFLADIEDCDPLNSFTGNENDAVFQLREYAPSTGRIIAEFPAKKGEVINIRFKDSDKKTLNEWQSPIEEDGTFEKVLDVYRLPAGLYYIEYNKGDWLVERAVQIN